MPKREIGIRGYVGELIVEQWLRCKFKPNKGYEIVNQIRPRDIDGRGGPYLDFGVIRKGKVFRIYEVKTQNYPLESLNSALQHVWKHPIGPYLIQDREGELNGTNETEAFLILLAPPNKTFIKKMREQHRNYILFFKKILDDLQEMQAGVDLKDIQNCFCEDAQKTVEEIKRLSLD